MITKVFMPKLSDAMETGKVIKWLKKEGDAVKGGDVIAEIETDKANVEIEAFGAGVLRKIVVEEGGTVPVGEMIGVIADPSEDISSMAAAKPRLLAGGRRPGARGQAVRAAPAAAPAAASGPYPRWRPTGPCPPPTRWCRWRRPARGPGSGRRGGEPGRPGEGLAAGQQDRGPVRSRPAAGRGHGPGGRIIRRDVEAAKTAPPAVAALSRRARRPGRRPGPAAVRDPARPEAEYEDVAMSPMRAAIAKRMPMSKAPVPHFYVTSEVEMDRAWALREQLNALEGQPKVSVTDIVIRAVALALIKNPGVNAQFNGQSIRVYHRAHIGMAVALDKGLITPVLRDCDVKPLARIAVESQDLAERARGGKLRAQEMSGATFSISNLGMFDVEEFSAIINPPEGAILAVGAVLQKPVVENGELRAGRRIRVTLSCDHRVMDGAMGARFLLDVKRLLQEPLRLLV